MKTSSTNHNFPPDALGISAATIRRFKQHGLLRLSKALSDEAAIGRDVLSCGGEFGKQVKSTKAKLKMMKKQKI